MGDEPEKPQTVGEALAKAGPATEAKLSSVLGRGVLDEVRAASLPSLGRRMMEIEKEREALLKHVTTPTGRSLAERAGFVSRSMGVLDSTRATSGIIAQAIRDQERAIRMTRAATVANESISPARPAFKIPPNPILKTNELIGDLSRRIDSVNELSAQQIDIQSKQVELIQALLLEYMQGSTTQDMAVRAAHKANIIAILGVITGIVIALSPWVHRFFTT